MEIEIIKTTDKLPQVWLNVMVNYEVHHQDYWTRAFHINGQWNVMTFKGTILLDIDKVKEWHYLISYVA